MVMVPTLYIVPHVANAILSVAVISIRVLAAYKVESEKCDAESGRERFRVHFASKPPRQLRQNENFPWQQTVKKEWIISKKGDRAKKKEPQALQAFVILLYTIIIFTNRVTQVSIKAAAARAIKPATPTPPTTTTKEKKAITATAMPFSMVAKMLYLYDSTRVCARNYFRSCRMCRCAMACIHCEQLWRRRPYARQLSILCSHFQNAETTIKKTSFTAAWLPLPERRRNKQPNWTERKKKYQIKHSSFSYQSASGVE